MIIANARCMPKGIVARIVPSYTPPSIFLQFRVKQDSCQLHKDN